MHLLFCILPTSAQTSAPAPPAPPTPHPLEHPVCFIFFVELTTAKILSAYVLICLLVYYLCLLQGLHLTHPTHTDSQNSTWQCYVLKTHVSMSETTRWSLKPLSDGPSLTLPRQQGRCGKLAELGSSKRPKGEGQLGPNPKGQRKSSQEKRKR